MPYWTLADLQDRLSKETVLQTFDDQNTGTPTPSAIARLQADCDAEVNGYLRSIYDLAAVAQSPPVQVKRLSLDYAEVIAARRNPSYSKQGYKDLLDAFQAEMMKIRTGVVRLDVETSPEPAANNGGTLLESGGVDDGMVLTPVTIFNGSPRFGGGFGDF